MAERDTTCGRCLSVFTIACTFDAVLSMIQYSVFKAKIKAIAAVKINMQFLLTSVLIQPIYSEYYSI